VTTTRLIRTIRARASWVDQHFPLPAVIAAGMFLLFAAVGAIGRLDLRSSAAAVPTPMLPVILIATPAPLPTHEAIQVAAVEPVRYVVLFDQPNGNALGAVPAPATSAIEARYGDSWYMITWNGAPGWIRAADIGWNIANLAPERVVYVPVQAAPQAPYSAPPTLEPPPPPTLAPQQLVILDRQQWAEEAQQHNGGSGKMQAPELGAPSDAQWCAAAAQANAGARCVEP